MARTIRITPKDSEELAFLCELFDRLGLEYSVDDEAPAGSHTEEFFTTVKPKSGSEMRNRMVAQALLAEEEVKQGKGLRPNDARDFMNDEFKAVALKTKGVRFDRDEANSR
jgi:hypothetical protein